VLRWLRWQDVPCPLHRGLTDYAAREGHLEVLIWLQRHVCSWDEEVERTIKYAMQQQGADTWRCCSGCEQGKIHTVSGTPQSMLLRLPKDTSKC